MKRQTLRSQRVIDKAIRLLYTFIQRTEILEKGDEFIAGISGGKDSTFMLDLLFRYSRSLNSKWKIIPVYIHLNHFPLRIKGEMESLFKRYTEDYVILNLDIEKSIKKGESVCYLCSRLRKMKLFELAEKRGIKKIAMAHTMDDVVETYLMNIIFSGETSTVKPVQNFFNGKFLIIRPVYLCDSKLVNEYLEACNLNIVASHECKYALYNKRDKIRQFLMSMEDEYMIRKNIYRAIFNINREYLPQI